MRSLLAISNAFAGTSNDDAVEAGLAALQDSFDVSHVQTSSPDDLDDALIEHADVEVVAALGGDGSLHAVVNAVYRADRLDDVAVALIPLGTGNDFARTLELPDDPAQAAARVSAAEGRRIDVIHDSHGLVVNVATVGLGAEAALRSSRYKARWGPAGYVLGALTSLLVPDKAMKVTVDGTEIRRRSGRVTQVSVGNGRFVGGGAELFPRARLDDAKMDVQIVFAPTLVGRVAWAWRIITRSTDRSAAVKYACADEVVVKADDLRCTSDGELGEPASHYEWSMLPEAVRLLA